ncbi:MAG: thrombospondin type 3 repeat-containing protein [Gammaproteobacteria bacterium]
MSRDQARVPPVSVALALLLACLLAPLAQAEGLEVYVSPADDGQPAPAAPVALPHAVPTVLHLYLRGTPPTPSPSGTPCGGTTATGSEICGWDLHLTSGAGIEILAFTPAADVVHHLADGHALRANGGRAQQPDVSAQKVGDVTVRATGAASLEVTGVQYVDAGLHRRPVDAQVLAASTAPDGDGDGITDDQDNCTAVANADQRDSDQDGYGNVCDADLNNDGVVNFLDLGVMKSKFFGTDPHADLNGDGAVNFIDLGLMKSRFFQAPGPSGVAP